MRKAILVLTILFFISTGINAQFQEGKNFAGPTIGLSFSGSTVSFGANFEHGMKMADIPGLIGIGGIFRYWSYGDGPFSYTDIVIAAQGNYHLLLEDKKLDPYFGLILGYDVGSWDYDGPYSDYFDTTYGGFILGVTGGVRYWFSPKMAVNARFGTGSNLGSTLDVGVDFKF